MSEVKRYPMFGDPSIQLVLSTNFDAERALRLEAERQLASLLADRDAEKSMKAKAREQRDMQTAIAKELKAKLDEAIGLLRRNLVILESADVQLREYGSMIYSVGDGRLDDALGGIDVISEDTRVFLNTNSTEGKDHA